MMPIQNKSGDCNNDDARSETIPLSDHAGGESKTLNGITYTLVLFSDPPSSGFKGVMTRLAKVSVGLAVFPLYVTWVGCFYVFMLIAPSSIKESIVSFMTPRMCRGPAKRFEKQRLELLHKSIRPGDVVLDVGSGGGAYMKHLSAASHVVALEPLTKLGRAIRQEAEEARINNITVVHKTLEEYAMTAAEKNNPNQFDLIILGNVLCEVPNQPLALEAIQSLLKPRGRIYFSEHVAHPRHTMARRLEDLYNPIWCTCTGGCNINRDTLDLLKTKFLVISWEYKMFGLRWVMGIAQNKQRTEVDDSVI